MNKNDNRIDVGAVFKMVKQFFEQEEESHDGEANIPCFAIDKLSLLRIACMGNAEKTIQGELFRHLRCKHKLNAVIECGYRDFDDSFDRHIDIMVFDNDWSPIVSIELKHYSPHQGTINPLLGGLEADYNKPRPKGIPLIQVGLYTEIDSVTPFPLQQQNYPLLQYYRFFMSYVLPRLEELSISVMEKKYAADKQAASTWAETALQERRYSEITELFRGRVEEFKVASSTPLKVTGRVNWIAMLAS